MSTPPRRRVLDRVDTTSAAHPGLLLNHYLSHAADSTEDAQRARDDLIDATISAVGRVALLYERAYTRWRRSFPSITQHDIFSVKTRLIVGLGGHHVMETGLTLHHTYGTPIIPGTSLKGLASHYCHQVWGASDGPSSAKFRGDPGAEGDAHRIIFGTSDEGGLVDFQDAWITPQTLRGSLRPDVMTPHHSGYYAGSQDTPSAFDDPIPVPFISVVGSFLVPITVSDRLPQGDAWARLTLELLRHALSDWGVGGKTSSGYGRM